MPSALHVVDSSSATDEAPSIAAAAMTLAELAARATVPLERLIGPILHPTVTLLHAPPGAGKTILAHEIALAVATGQSELATAPLPGWLCGPPRGVAIIDGELPLDELKRRLASTERGRRAEIHLLANMELKVSQDKLIDLSQPDQRAELTTWLLAIRPKIGLVILDNLTALTSARYDEDSATGQREINQWQAELRQLGISVLLVHHDNKSGSQRGSSAREAICDLTIQLARQLAEPIYLAAFDVIFRKARFLQAAPKNFSAKLVAGRWQFAGAESGLLSRLLVHMAATEEWDWRAIAQDLGISKPYVYLLHRRAVTAGLWAPEWGRPRRRRKSEPTRLPEKT